MLVHGAIFRVCTSMYTANHRGVRRTGTESGTKSSIEQL
jgi:hypothetical protein